MNSRSSVVVIVTVFAGVVVVALAAAIGYAVGRSGHRPGGAAPGSVPVADAAQQVYTCSMHPQVRLDRPGKCPICDMPLVPADAAQSGPEGRPELSLSEHALAMANVETTPVTRRELSRELRAVGRIQYNETSLGTVTARVDGYAERLFVNFTGVEIKAGDHLAEVYSPELLVAQQELLIALQSGSGRLIGPMVDTAKLKLQRWGLTEEQIQALVENKKIADRVTLYSPIQGTVIEKSIVQNSAFKAGDALYRVANLDTVWVYLDIYEYDLAWVRYGQRVDVIAEALPGKSFEGRVTFVEPIVREETRTIRVPVFVENEDHVLKPGMFVSAVIRSRLAKDGGAAPTGVEGKFSCPMHPQVLREETGTCPVCEMPLEQIPGQASEPEAADELVGPADPSPAEIATPHFCPMKCEGEKNYESAGNCPVCKMRLEPVEASRLPAGSGLLAVPASAVLDSGTRKIVYVEKSTGLFEPRELVLGPRAGEFFPVLEGVSEGERIVTRGGFLIDSQFQITGHSSLFYPGGLMGSSGGHQHGAAPAASSDSSPPPPLTSPSKSEDASEHQHGAAPASSSESLPPPESEAPESGAPSEHQHGTAPVRNSPAPISPPHRPDAASPSPPTPPVDADEHEHH
jgi:Cu(I)/Ag(I) efflux system membrane fusion protein